MQIFVEIALQYEICCGMMALQYRSADWYGRDRETHGAEGESKYSQAKEPHHDDTLQSWHTPHQGCNRGTPRESHKVRSRGAKCFCILRIFLSGRSANVYDHYPKEAC